MKQAEITKNIVEDDREVLVERQKAKTLSGSTLIISTVAVLVGAIMAYQVLKLNDFFGDSDKKPKKTKVEVSNAPTTPRLEIPEIESMPVPVEPLVSENIVNCNGGLRLPAGMPCPGEKVAQAENNSNSEQSKAPEKKGMSDTLKRKLGGSVSAVSADLPEKEQETNKTISKSANNELDTIENKPIVGLGAEFPQTYTPQVSASVNLNPSLTLLKGTLPDCTLVTAIKTSVKGFAKCKVSMPVYSMDGKVVLMEAGTEIEAEYRGNVSAGNTTIQLIGTRAVTPKGVIIPFDSPFTDALGRAGADGMVDHKWLLRFGGAVLSALIEDGIDVYKTNQQQAGNGNNNVISQTPNTNSSTKAITDELLKQGSRVRPDLVVNQGKILKIFVARDIDFSKVYRLKSKESTI